MEINFSNTNGFSSPRYNILVIKSIYLYLLLWLSTNKTGYKQVGCACVYRPKDSLRGRREWGGPVRGDPHGLGERLHRGHGEESCLFLKAMQVGGLWYLCVQRNVLSSDPALLHYQYIQTNNILIYNVTSKNYYYVSSYLLVRP